jgi:chitinase
MKTYLEHGKLRGGLAVLLLSGLILLCGRAQAQLVPTHHSPVLTKRIIGDYGYWSKSQTPPYGAKQIPYSKLTHIIHFNISFDSNGTITIPDGFLEPSLLRKAHKAGVKVMVGLNGNFPMFDGNPQLEATFVQNLQSFIFKYGYDGVDVDWEYPTADETDTFYNLYVDMRSALPSPDYQLSADVPPWGDGGGGYAIPQVDPYIDYFNIMQYDCAGPWTADGQLNSEIFWDPSDPDPWECQPGGAASESVTIFEQAGVPPSQLNMGTPFYGYLYSDVSELFGDCPPAGLTKSGNCHSVWSENYGTFFKQRINKKDWQTFYDPIALVPYMLRVDGKPGFITYDDAASTYYRVWYSDWQWNLGGTFMWSLDADYDGHSQDLLDAMYAASLGLGN